MTQRIPLVAALVFVTTGLATAAEPENFIKYRQGVMKAIGGHMAASTQIVRGKVNPEGHLSMHAQAMEKLTADIPVLFPEGSDFGETKAKEGIWEDWDKFTQAAERSTKAVAAFAAAVAGGDAAGIAEAHKAVGKSCKGCHEDFRQEDE